MEKVQGLKGHPQLYHKYKASQGYTVRACQSNTHTPQNQNPRRVKSLQVIMEGPYMGSLGQGTNNLMKHLKGEDPSATTQTGVRWGLGVGTARLITKE